MDRRKRLAIQLAGIERRFPYSVHEPTKEQKFDQLWPSLKQEYLERADAVFRLQDLPKKD